MPRTTAPVIRGWRRITAAILSAPAQAGRGRVCRGRGASYDETATPISRVRAPPSVTATMQSGPRSPLAWQSLAPGLFVLFWASGFLAAKLGLPYARPLTLL